MFGYTIIYNSGINLLFKKKLTKTVMHQVKHR